LLERVASGQCSTADRLALARWVGTDPERQHLVESVERVVRGIRAMPTPDFDAPASLARARRRLGLSGDGPDRAPVNPPPPAASHGHGVRRSPDLTRTSRAGLLVAASLVVAAGLAVGVGRLRPDRTNDLDRVYATAAGERAELRLTDGTRVVLAPASRLRVVGRYGKERRAVMLDGEAFFTVVHDAAIPFTVRAGNMLATDVGTRFDVAAYRGDTAVRVAVAEGRVSLASAAQPTVPLAGGDVASVGTTGVASVTHEIDVSALTSWTAGRLDFRAVPLRDALPALARWYDIDVAVADTALGGVPLTASFRDEPVTEVLHIVAVTVGARVIHRGNTLVFVSRGASVRSP
jgi:transmembrane sensor